MRIILSPAKKMKVNADTVLPMTEPAFLPQTTEIMHWGAGALLCRSEETLGLQ